MPVEVICGPMFSGKTEELIRRITRAKYARQNVLAVKPSIDDRYEKKFINSHSGSREACVTLAEIDQLFPILEQGDLDLVAIEEAQFFEQGKFAESLNRLNRLGIKVIVAGLDMDFMGNPFENIVHAMGVAEKVDKISAVCVRCGKDATMTHKKKTDGPRMRVEVGENDLYDARCHSCWLASPCNQN